MLINVQNNRISAMVVGERTLAIHLKTEEAQKFYEFLKTKSKIIEVTASTTHTDRYIKTLIRFDSPIRKKLPGIFWKGDNTVTKTFLWKKWWTR